MNKLTDFFKSKKETKTVNLSKSLHKIDFYKDEILSKSQFYIIEDSIYNLVRIIKFYKNGKIMTQIDYIKGKEVNKIVYNKNGSIIYNIKKPHIVMYVIYKKIYNDIYPIGGFFNILYAKIVVRNIKKEFPDINWSKKDERNRWEGIDCNLNCSFIQIEEINTNNNDTLYLLFQKGTFKNNVTEFVNLSEAKDYFNNIYVTKKWEKDDHHPERWHQILNIDYIQIDEITMKRCHYLLS